MRFEPETVKGFQDFLPPKSLKRTEIRKIIEKYFNLYGFLPVETPSIEFDENMRQDNLLDKEDEAVSDRFRLQDRGGRNLGLRYEFTFQLSRIFKQNPNLKLPFKKYQIGSVFRDEPVTSIRFREFTQCDADIIGDNSLEAEAECLAVFNDILKELKVDSTIEINNRKLLNSIIESVNIQNSLAAIREIDKLDKIGEDDVKTNLRRFCESSQIITLFKLLEKPLEFFTENLFEGAEELTNLQKIAKNYGLELKFNPYLARGLSYYTGNIFEIKTKELKGSIAAGGRYDKIVGKYLGKEIPAVGISFGLERLTTISKIETQFTKTSIISLKQDKEAIRLAKKLRKEDISCSTFFGKPGKALEYTNSYKIPYAIFIGQEEAQKKKFKLKDMKSGDEKLLTEKQIISKLKK